MSPHLLIKHKLAAFTGYRGLFDCDCACAAPPNYGPTAAASEKAAQLGYDLGKEQLVEAQRQYGLNKAVSDQVVAKQLALMDQTKQQGDDYYNFNVNTFRPIEQGLAGDANLEGSDARMEEQAGQAAADARRGQAQQANMMVRQGLRYGYSPSKMAAMAGQLAGANSSAVAGAMTGARDRQRNLGWARRMDVTGLGRNLPGASVASYGLANNSGNSAVANQNLAGQGLLSGMAQGAGMQQTGMGQNLAGLNSILQSQSSVYNASQAAQANSGDSGLGGLGSLLGGGASIYTAFA